MDKSKPKQDLKKPLKLTRQDILPGFSTGKYEAQPGFDRAEFAKPDLEDPMRRDNRISIRVSGTDMGILHQLALAEGVPVQSFIGKIVHQYAAGELEPGAPKPAPKRAKSAAEHTHKRD